MARSPGTVMDDWDLPHEQIKTMKGRVIYFRVKRKFSGCDLKRVAKAIEMPEKVRPFLCYLDATEIMLKNWSDLDSFDVKKKIDALLGEFAKVRNASKDLDGTSQFRFGGGGASGEFGKPWWWLGPIDD